MPASKARAAAPDDSQGSLTTGDAGVPDHLTWYLLLLLLFLAMAGFFDSYATTFRYTMTTYAREDFQVDFGFMAKGFTWVYLGSCLAFIPRVLADVCGRKIMLCVTMSGLCALQWLVGLARSPYEYIALLTVLAIFYKSDIWILVMSEEAPPKHRGLFAAATAAIAVGGALTVGEMVRRMGHAPAPDAWRQVARFPIWGLAATIPLFFLMRETHHFRHRKYTAARATGIKVLLAPFEPRWRSALFTISILKMLFAAGAITAMALLGTEYLRVDNGFAPPVVGRVIQYQELAIMGAWVSAGLLSDWIGRRRAAIMFGLLYIGALLSLALLPKGSNGVIIAHVAQVYGATAVYAILRIATMELFPNHCRATGSAWTDLFMTLFAVVTANVLGWATHRGIPLSTCIIAVAVLVALVLPLFGLLPETRGRRLEEV